MPQSRAAAGALVVLAVIFVVLAILYAAGVIGWLANPADKQHYKHAIVLTVLAVVSLVAANFARPRAAV
jgi:hypothetical protein